MKNLLLALIVFAVGTLISHAHELENLPIIKRLDKKYLKLIDKNGKITNLKEFNKNGVVVVFKDIKTKTNPPTYLIIDAIIDPISGLDILHVIYTKAIEPYFSNKPAKINFDYENGEHKAPIMNFKLDIHGFTFEEFTAHRGDAKLKQQLSMFYQNHQLEEISKIVSGYIVCIIRTNNIANRSLPSTFQEGCNVEFYDKTKENQIKTLLNIV